MSAITEFYTLPGQAATLLGRTMSEMLAILKIEININCNAKFDKAQALDKKADNRVKFLKFLRA